MGKLLVIVLPVCLLLVITSVTAAMGYGTVEPVAKTNQTNQSDFANTQENNEEDSTNLSKSENLGETSPETFSVDNIVKGNAQSTFDVQWDSQTGAASQKHTTVHYGYLTTNEGVTTWNEVLPAFQTATVYRDYSAMSGTTFSQNEYEFSMFDIRYYEESYTNTDGRQYAYHDSYVSNSSTFTNSVQMTKLFYNSVNNNWMIRNDLVAENGGWQQPSSLNNGDTHVWMVFKDVTPTGEHPLKTDVDFYAKWLDGSQQMGRALCQYAYFHGGTQMSNIEKLMPPFAGDLNMTYGSTMTMFNYCGRYVRIPVDGVDTNLVYSSAYASLGTSGGQETTDWHEVYAVRCSGGNWQYQTTSGGQWITLGSLSQYPDINITFIYSYADTSVVETLDTLDKGIHINVVDYEGWRNTETSGASNVYQFINGINKFSDFKFSAARNGTVDVPDVNNATGNHEVDNINRVTSNDRARQGIVSKALSALGYPDLAITFTTPRKTDLSYLFDYEQAKAVGADKYEKWYTELNHLFYAETYNDTGYYEFDSSNHFAQLRKKADYTDSNASNDVYDTSKDFVVYEEPTAVPGDQFLPLFSPFDDKNNVDTTNRDYLFGMTIDSEFAQPLNGQITWQGQTNDMVFEFNGDDDVFVYIDGALVLDLGGIHGAVGGSINFRTGAVSVQRVVDGGSTSTTLIDAFDAAGIVDKNDPESWGQYFVQDGQGQQATYRFIDYTRHVFKFVYFERGEGATNCRIKFNLYTIPEGQLEIGKHIDATEAEEQGATVDKSGKFYYKVQQTPALTDPTVWSDYDGEYDVYKGVVGSPDREYVTTRHSGSIKTLSGKTLDGVIYIEDGQVAVLKGYDTGTYFQAVEFDPSQSGEVDINGLKWSVFLNDDTNPAKQIDITGPSGKEGTWWGETGMKSGSIIGVEFINKVNMDSLCDLYVNKQGRPDSESPTDLTVYFNGGTDPDTGEPIVTDAEKYRGIYYYVDAEGTKLHEDPLTTEDGIISFYNEIQDEHSNRIMIPNVQMGTRATLVADSDRLGQQTIHYWVEKYVGPESAYVSGQMIEDYNDLVTKYAASIPDLDYNILKERGVDFYGEIFFEVIVPNNTLTLSKEITGIYGDKTKQFQMSIGLVNSEDPSIHYKSDEIFEGVLHRRAVTEEDIDIDAKINDYGEILISEAGQEAYTYPALANNDLIVIYGIMPKSNIYSLFAFEEYVSVYEQTFNKLLPEPSIKDAEISYEYEPSVTSEIEFRRSDYVETDGKSNYTILLRNKYNDTPTGLDIFKNPDLWIFILAVLLTLMVAGPIKIINVRRRRRKLFSPDDDVFNDNLFAEEGFIW